MRVAIAVSCMLVGVVLAPGRVHAQLEVGAGGSFDLGTGTLDLGCTSLVAAGSVDVAGGSLSRALDVSIDPGGTIDGGTGALEVSGDWSNAGSFIAGSGSVRFVDDCGPGTATVSGANTFHDLEMTTLVGKLYRLEAGVTQTVTGFISLAGTDEDRLLLRSTSGGSEAFLQANGAQSLEYLDVQDNHATGSAMQAPGSLDSGNTQGWLFQVSVPALGIFGTLALAASLMACARAGPRAAASKGS